jgi:hypothetical protein
LERQANSPGLFVAACRPFRTTSLLTQTATASMWRKLAAACITSLNGAFGLADDQFFARR